MTKYTELCSRINETSFLHFEGDYPTTTPLLFHIEMTWEHNVKFTWCFCRVKEPICGAEEKPEDRQDDSRLSRFNN